ncbi:MAG: acyl carrier protein [Butyrivibrio sp.]|nr:acyl carrier protein [Butyrivibrio sp.]
MIKVSEIILKLKDVLKYDDITANTDLFGEGIIDSISLFDKILPIIEGEYGIEIHPLELVPSNFETPSKITDYINRKKYE